MQWSFSNMGSAQLLSFQGDQDDKPKTGFDSLTSSGLVTMTTDVFGSDHKSFSAAPKIIIPENQGGVSYTVTSYPIKHVDTYAIRRQSISPAVTPFLHHSPLVRATPSSSPVIGSTDIRNSSRISNAPAQMNIFYNGSVCVYGNVCPEKAQAIMLLAGNGPPNTAPVQDSVHRSSVLDRFAITHPISIKTEANAAKLSGVLVSSSPVNAEPLKSVYPLGSASFLSSDTVPQFRRKSLARFLEKRKERSISGLPYGDYQSPDCSALGAERTSLSTNSLGSCPVPAAN